MSSGHPVFLKRQFASLLASKHAEKSNMTSDTCFARAEHFIFCTIIHLKNRIIPLLNFKINLKTINFNVF